MNCFRRILFAPIRLYSSTNSLINSAISYKFCSFLSSPTLCRFSSHNSLAMDSTKAIRKRYDHIIKSSEDKRMYRGLELSNGLRVLLISDSSTDKSAASMDVNVGYLMDPWELPGLAHFCEHMLFLGTDKYPVENDYEKFISSHGGMTNARTCADHTNYHFDVTPEYLNDALDRFVQFFLTPRFSESATNREVCAVDSECSNNSQSDNWRILQLEGSLSKPGHDFGKFGTGNKRTLMEIPLEKGIDVRSALMKFHEQHYSSDIMTCSILGRESLDELENMVLSLNFGDIKQKGCTKKVWNEGPYGKEQLCKRIEVVPIKDLRFLTLIFPIPDFTDEYRSQPAHYISHLIGHEGRGSLLSELKRRGWVTSLSAAGQSIANGFGLFNVSVDLTEEGLCHVDDIIEVMFNEIGLLKSTGPLEWVHNELRQLAEIKFKFKDKENPICFTTDLSSDLQRIPFKDILCSNYKLDQYNPELISSVLEQLTPENMIYGVISRTFASKTKLKEEWYQTDYNIANIDEKLLMRCKTAMSTPLKSLEIPCRNEYIATNFDLKPKAEVTSTTPQLIRSDAWSRVWFMQDSEFNLPKCSTKIAIHLPLISIDPQRTFLSAMFVSCFQDAIAEEVYNPFLAGLRSALEVELWGIYLNVCGYEEKQQLFVKNLVQRLANFVPDETRYEIMKEMFCRALRNFWQSQPYVQSQYYAGLLLGYRQWSKEQILACADHCDVNKLRDFIKEMLQAIHVEALIHGNKTKEEALLLVDDVISGLKVNNSARPLFEEEWRWSREYQLPKDNKLVLQAHQSTHANGCVGLILQTGPQNTRENVLLELVVQLACESAFNQLRTKEQLGYIVHTGTRRNNGVQSLQMIVQGEHDTNFVEERIETFLLNFRKSLDDMPDTIFRDHVEALAAKRLERPKTLNGKSDRFWSEIVVGFYHFDRVNVEVPVLREVTKDDLIEFFDSYIAEKSPNRRKLCIMVQGNSVDENTSVRRAKRSAGDDSQRESTVDAKDIFVIQKGMSLHPTPQSIIEIPLLP